MHAEQLPFDDDAFDAAMACLTVHHWDPVEAGFDGALRLVVSEPA